MYHIYDKVNFHKNNDEPCILLPHCILLLHCIYGKGTHIPFPKLNFLDLLTLGNIFKI